MVKDKYLLLLGFSMVSLVIEIGFWYLFIFWLMNIFESGEVFDLKFIEGFCYIKYYLFGSYRFLIIIVNEIFWF